MNVEMKTVLLLCWFLIFLVDESLFLYFVGKNEEMGLNHTSVLC